MKLGRLHCVDQCPDAPFVIAMGGDKSSDNLKVLDVREAASGRECRLMIALIDLRKQDRKKFRHTQLILILLPKLNLNFLTKT